MKTYLLGGIAALGLVFSANAANADWAKFTGKTKEDLQFSLDHAVQPMVIIYTDSTKVKGKDKDFLVSIRTDVESHYKGKVTFAVVDLAKTPGVELQPAKIPYMDVYQLTKNSVDDQVESAELLGRFTPGTQPFMMRAFVDEGAKTKLDTSKEPFVLAVQTKSQELEENIAVLTKALAVSECRASYGEAVKKSFERWMDGETALIDQKRDLNEASRDLRVKVGAYYAGRSDKFRASVSREDLDAALLADDAQFAAFADGLSTLGLDGERATIAGLRGDSIDLRDEMGEVRSVSAAHSRALAAGLMSVERLKSIDPALTDDCLATIAQLKKDAEAAKDQPAPADKVEEGFAKAVDAVDGGPASKLVASGGPVFPHEGGVGNGNKHKAVAE
ncbi:MAG: hypothetical protein HY075_12910 [Deltaproteobacteria bacterium]|nr:hypothetical protein [Deltaproteobacteria bacterium]